MRGFSRDKQSIGIIFCVLRVWNLILCISLRAHAAFNVNLLSHGLPTFSFADVDT